MIDPTKPKPKKPNPFEDQYQASSDTAVADNPFEANYAASEPAKPPEPEVGMGEGLVRAGSQGLTMGFGEELKAAADAFGGVDPATIIGGMLDPKKREAYTAIRDAERAKQASFSKHHMIASGAAELAGGLPTALLGAPAGAMKAGAVFGGLAGLGHGEGDIADQAKGAAEGAALGGGTAGLLSGLMRPVKNLTGALLTRLNWRPKNTTLGMTGTKDLAKNYVRTAFENDAITSPGEIAAGVGPAGGQPNEILADVGGENVRRGLAAVQGMRGPTANAAKTLLEDRQAGQYPRITESVRRIFGVSKPNADRAAKEIVANYTAESKPLYDKAYSHGAVDDAEINKLLENRWFRRAYAKARGVADDEGVKLPEIYKQTGHKAIQTKLLDSNGKPITKLIPIYEKHEVPNVQTLDYIKRELDGIIIKGKANTGKGGLSSTQARAIRRLRDKFVGRLDEIVPDYGVARAQNAGGHAVEQALEDGTNIFSRARRLDADEVANLSADERDAFLVGAFKAIKGKMGSINSQRDLTKLLDNPDVVEQLQQMAGSPAKFQELMSTLASEEGMAKTAASITGSRTAPMAQTMADIEGVTPDVVSAMGTVLRGHPIAGGAQALRALFSRNQSRPAGGVTDEIGKLLMQPATAPNVQSVFQQAAPTPARGSAMLGQVAGAATAPQLSSNTAGARTMAVQLRTQGASDEQMAQQLGSMFTPGVIKFVIAATPKRLAQ